MWNIAAAAEVGKRIEAARKKYKHTAKIPPFERWVLAS
jgi:hypothetical protein